MPQAGGPTFSEILSLAVADLLVHGFDTEERVTEWMEALRQSAERSMVPVATIEETLKRALRDAYRAKVEHGGILRMHSGVSRFTLDRVKPKLRAELDRRIMASANLIKLNRRQTIEATLQRFSGWATSIPAGGTRAPGVRAEAKDAVRKSMASLSFRERRVAIDQGHKFTANLSEILAVDGGALGGFWHSHWRRPGYDYREDHKERDEHFYVVRGNWALEQGLMKLAGRDYTDEITRPGEEVYCSCWYQWIHSLSRLPHDMLTEKGREAIVRGRMAA